MARPSKFTPAARAAILLYIRSGNTRKTAAEAAGVEESTVRRWLIRGREQGSGVYHTFFTDVKRAEAEAIALAVSRIREAGRETWQANAWWLERRYPHDWGQRLRVDLRQRIEADLEDSGLPDDEREEIIEEALRIIQDA